jgi:hypothetical protein
MSAYLQSARRIIPLDWWYGTRKRVVATLSSGLCAWCGKWGSKLTYAKPQFKLGAFDNILHHPQARKSLCKHFYSCSRPSCHKPCKGGCITVGRPLGNKDVRRYNIFTTNKVVMIIPGEPKEVWNYDVIVQRQCGGGLQQTNELAPSYDTL